ncbi:beta-propeller fold lactonase family protein [Streptacidiphilus sp. P02-A3a]|uniref:lactonase family protein n=1 Tax=Streptacidiphilus sp. P02-A3a TaxID=2704468 RepID=UPI0015FA64A3|nr:beta-propeller fold lactonase family protein [Streptacidiphilus sp. P02-A3a]QMU69308.1 lactonase family protein [Streptacidiphilus sp. P02-A3a]
MNGPQLLVTGCYAPDMDGRGTGLTCYRRDPRDGSLTPVGALPLPSPSYLVQHPTLPLLYTTNEAGEEGSVSVVAIEDDGALRELARVPSQGGWPCHLAFGEGGRRLGVANYRTGTALLLDLDAAGLPTGGGRLWAGDPDAVGPRADRQDAPHAHMVVPGPDGLWTVVDLGTDQLRSHGPEGGPRPLAVTALPAGTGPRQLVRGADGLAYLAGELDSRLHVLRETAPGAWAVLGSVPATAVESAGGNLPAQLTVSGDGTRVYLSNRGADTVALFRTGSADELPRFVAEFPSGGSGPRHLEAVGDHLYVSNENSDTLTVHAVDAVSGALTVLRQYPTGSPTCALAVRPAVSRPRTTATGPAVD